MVLEFCELNQSIVKDSGNMQVFDLRVRIEYIGNLSYLSLAKKSYTISTVESGKERDMYHSIFTRVYNSRLKDLKIEEKFRKHKRSSRHLWSAPKTSVFEFTDRLCIPENNEHLCGITGRFEFNCELNFVLARKPTGVRGMKKHKTKKENLVAELPKFHLSANQSIL